MGLRSNSVFYINDPFFQALDVVPPEERENLFVESILPYFSKSCFTYNLILSLSERVKKLISKLPSS